MAKHRAGKPVDPEKPFKHKHVKGESQPSKVKAQTDRIDAAERAHRLRIDRENS